MHVETSTFSEIRRVISMRSEHQRPHDPALGRWHAAYDCRDDVTTFG
jgi:hypothetical protein